MAGKRNSSVAEAATKMILLREDTFMSKYWKSVELKLTAYYQRLVSALNLDAAKFSSTAASSDTRRQRYQITILTCDLRRYTQ